MMKKYIYFCLFYLVSVLSSSFLRFLAIFYGILGRDPFNQHSDRSDREKRTTSKGGPVFSKLFRLDRTDPLSFGPKFPETLVEWIAPLVTVRGNGLEENQPIESLDRSCPVQQWRATLKNINFAYRKIR